MDLMQIKIAKDEQIVSYIKLIREYDKSMSMSHIKQKIESNDFVVTNDTNDYDVVDEINGIDKNRAFRELIGNCKEQVQKQLFIIMGELFHWNF